MRNEKQVIFSPATLTNYTSLSFLLSSDTYRILCIILYCASSPPPYSQGFYSTLCLYFCNRNPGYRPWTWAWSLPCVVSHPVFPGWALGSPAYRTEWPARGWGSGEGRDPDQEKAEVTRPPKCSSGLRSVQRPQAVVQGRSLATYNLKLLVCVFEWLTDVFKHFHIKCKFLAAL